MSFILHFCYCDLLIQLYGYSQKSAKKLMQAVFALGLDHPM